MKIFEVIPQLATGGAERFIVDISNELAKTNEVTLVVFWPLKGAHKFYLSQLLPNVDVVCLDKNPGLDVSIFAKFWKIVKNKRPDIIHTHTDSILYTCFAQAFLAKGVHTVHSEADKEAAGKAQRIVRKILFGKKIVTPVTISPMSHNNFVKYYRAEASSINNGRDVPFDLIVTDIVKKEFETYRKNDKTRVIVQLAHIDRVKRQVIMAQAAKKLYNDGYNFSVLFIGSSTREPEITEQVKAEMPPCCYILGERSNPLEYLKEAGAFGLCSQFEGLPISLIEAIGVGAIPICTPVGGIVNIINDGDNGFLSDNLEMESYYKALKRYLDLSNDDRIQMSKKVYESYAPYTMKECAANYLALFNKLLSN